MAEAMGANFAHLARSRYPEDIRPPGHASVWGSWYCSETRRWGFSCCRATGRSAPPCRALASETDVESSRGTRRSHKAPPPVRDWRQRNAFETAEGFIAHVVQFLATQWSDKLHDGTLASSDAVKNPSVAQAILSETNAAEATRGVHQFCERLTSREVPADLCRHLEDFCTSIGLREYVQANKAYMEIVMGSRKWQRDVPYLVEGNRNGPAVVQSVAERINKTNANPLDATGIRDHTVTLRRLLTVAQAAHPNQDPSKNCG